MGYRAAKLQPMLTIFRLNYFDGDFEPISGNIMPIANFSTLSSGYRPLYNGNISSMGVSVKALTNPLLYDYQYDQLNRLIHMDAYRTTDSLWSSPSILQDFQENVAYDPNGNILKYKRNGNNTFAGKPIGMDSLSYFYNSGTNKLDHIVDSVPATNYTTDLDSQGVGNYGYDAIGELTQDNASSISNVTWTVYGKINTITKTDGSSISFTYDAAGERINKTYDSAGGPTIITWYVRDAQGNVLSIYTSGNPMVNSGDLTRTEAALSGSNRLGLKKDTVDMADLGNQLKVGMIVLDSANILTFTRGKKLFELNNHLGNVLATISDKKLGISIDGTTVDHFNPQVLDANDYYPFGSLEPGRSYVASSVGNYRYGFNGKENDNEVKGVGNQQDYGMRIYDPRLGRFLSIDPITKKYPDLTPYQFASNRPIEAIDLDGLEAFDLVSSPHRYLIHQATGSILRANKPPPPAKDVNPDPTPNKSDFRIPVQQFYPAIVPPGSNVPGMSPSPPPLGLIPQQENDESRKEQMEAIGRDENGNLLPWAQLAENKTFKNFANNVALPILTAYTYVDGVAELRNIFVAGEAALKSKSLAEQFYRLSGFSDEVTRSHIQAIDFSHPVETVTLKKGTIIQQWVGERGVGNYFTTLENGSARNLGLNDYNARTLQKFRLNEDVTVLSSTAKEFQGGVGGGAQYFSTELKSKVTPLK